MEGFFGGLLMESAKTHLGTPELHKRHSVMIEGGKFPRSRVMDQFIFDRYLMQGKINLKQHRAAEFVLALASKAGIWAKGVKHSGDHIQNTKGSNVPFGMMPFGNVLRRIREECGPEHYAVTQAVIIYNKDAKDGIGYFSKSMDFVGDQVMYFHKNPLKHLE
jgi:hypothetical protein